MGLSWWDFSNHLARGYRLNRLREKSDKREDLVGLDSEIVPGDARHSEYWGSGSAYIGLGTNLGKREQNLLDAIKILEKYHHDDSELPKISSFYETDPIGCDGPKFLNAVMKIQTRLDPYFLIDTLLKIEHNFGRARPYPNAPRVIDLDLLFYSHLIIKNDKLTLPHPRLHERAFVLVPMVEIEPSFVHPVLGKLTDLLNKVDSEGVKKWSGEWAS